MAKESLLDVTVRNAKPGAKDKRLNDGCGLYLLIKPDGAKWWRFDYSIDGKRKTLSLGVYPVTGLADARRKVKDARIQISNGIDPSNTRKESKASKRLAAENAKRVDAGLPILNSFEHVARDWLASTLHTVRDITHNKKIQRFEKHVFPIIGGKTINEIKSPDIFSLVKPLFNKLETVHRVHAEISSVFGYAIAHGLTDFTPANLSHSQATKYNPHIYYFLGLLGQLIYIPYIPWLVAFSKLGL